MAILWNTGTILFDNFQFIGGMKFGEPSADGRGSAPPELAEQQARAGSEAAPEGRKALSHRCTDGVAV